MAANSRVGTGMGGGSVQGSDRRGDYGKAACYHGFFCSFDSFRENKLWLLMFFFVARLSLRHCES